MTLEARLQEAYGLLRQRRLPEADAACRKVLESFPGNGDALHLLGLIRKEAGDTAEGERLLRQSIDLAPGRAEFHANLGNLLRGLSRLGEAETAYRRALALDPGHGPARLGLARTLNDLGRHVEAEGECRVLVAARSGDPQAWSALAMTLRDQGRLGEAEEAYRRAIALQPDYSPAYNNLGALLVRMDRAEEALAMLDRAGALGLKGFEVSFNRARALVELYRFDEAEEAYAQAVALNPTHCDAQLNLAKLRYMRGDPLFARDLAKAAAANPLNVRLRLIFADVLRRTGDLRGSEILLRDLAARHGPTPEIRSSLATVLQEAGRLAEAEKEALAAVTARPQDSKLVENLVAVLLSRGRADEAMPFIQTERKRNPFDQAWIAYEATASRLLGAPAYESLYDYERLVRAYDLEPPPGWASIEELNAALIQALSARHRLVMHPFDQSLRMGSQTARNLLADPDPAIQAVLKAFEGPIEAYRQAVGKDDAHPLLARNHGTASIVGSWSVRLHRGGFHVNHIHPEGWISSAYYVSVPSEVEDARMRSGWIKFGEPRLPVPGAEPAHFVQPRAGRLVLFPSYMWHGTTPIEGPEPRMTIAFDVATPGKS